MSYINLPTYSGLAPHWHLKAQYRIDPSKIPELQSQLEEHLPGLIRHHGNLVIIDNEGSLSWAMPNARYSVGVDSRGLFTGVNLPNVNDEPATYPLFERPLSTTCKVTVQPLRAHQLQEGNSSISPGTTRVILDDLTSGVLDGAGQRWTDPQDCMLQYHGHDIGYSLTASMIIGTALTRSYDPDVPDLTEFKVVANIATRFLPDSAAAQGSLVDVTLDGEHWCHGSHCPAVRNPAAMSMTTEGPGAGGSGVPANEYHFIHWKPPSA